MTLAAVQTVPGLPNPTAMALASVTGGELEFYAATEGETAASLVGFQLGELSTATPGSPTASGARGRVSDLGPLSPTSLALVGTLLETSLTTSEATVVTGESATNAFETSSVEGGAAAASASSSDSGPARVCSDRTA